MRRILTIFAAILFVASFAAAQTGTTEKPKGKAQTTKTETAKPATHQLTGEVVKADASSVTIKPSKGAEQSFAITADTKIAQGTKAMTAGDVKTGEKVKVTYTKAGDTATATKIALPAPAAAPKAKAKTEAPAKK